MKRRQFFLQFLFLIAYLLTAIPGQARKDLDQKAVNLTVGLVQDEPLQYVPEGVQFEGDFRKVTKLSFAPELRVLRFNPFSPGTATLTLVDKTGKRIASYLLTVRVSNLSKIAREIKALLADIEGVEVKIVNNRVVVDGQILLPRDMNRIYSVVSQYGDQASSIVTLSPLAQKKIAEFIERDINNPEIHARAVNDKFILEGVANDEAEKQRAEIIAKTYVPDIIVEAAEGAGVIKKRKVDAVINLLNVKPAAQAEPGKIIQLVVHFVELQKDYEKGFRFQWTPDISDNSQVDFATGSQQGGGVISSITATISNLLPKLNWAKQHGHARVLQSSSLIVEDGKEGELRSVTRIPYQTINAQGMPITNFEEAGLISIITPKIINPKSDSIALSMKFNLKTLLGITDKGPLVTDKAIKTNIVVRSAQSAAVGGLVSNESGKDYNKLPKNTSSNPLFSLYASKSFRRNQSQFVVFVTPIIKSSASSGAERVKQKFRLRN